MAKIVIIGNSAAGHAALQTLLGSGASHELTVITEEAYPAYRRDALVEYFAGRSKDKELFLCGPDFYKEKGVAFLSQAKVQRLDTKKNRLILKDNTKVDYDRAVIASGEKVALPDISGKGKEGVIAWGGLEGVKQLRQLLIVGKTVCISGLFRHVQALAEAMAAARKEVKVITGDAPQDYAPPEGIEAIGGVTVAECIGEGAELQAVKLSSGKVVAVTAMVFTSPLVPSTEFLKEAGLELRGGYVVVDAAQRTAVSNVFACGAAATGPQAESKEKTWDEAASEGARAAESLLATV